MLHKILYMLFVVGILICGNRLSIAATEKQGFDVASGRPLGEALIALAEQRKCIITYEDPLFQHSSELERLHPGAKKFLPKTRTLSYTYEKNQSDFDIIQGLIDEYHQRGYAGRYKLIKEIEIFNVVPIQNKTQKGQWVIYESVCNKPITISLENTTIPDSFNAICIAVSKASPYKIFMDHNTVAAFRGISFSGEYKQEITRNIFNELTHVVNVHKNKHYIIDPKALYTWHMRYSPTSYDALKPFYLLMIRRISSSNPTAMKLRVSHERPMAIAAKILEKRLGSVIPYEDPPYVCDYDLLGNESGKRLRGGLIQMNWELNSSVRDVVHSLVTSRIVPRRNLNVFTSQVIDNIYYIYPNKYNNEEGAIKSYTSIMNRNISLKTKSVDGLVFLKLFCSELSAVANNDIKLIILSKNLSEKFKQHQFSEIIIEEQPARIALTQVLHQIEKDISWQLLYDPSSKQFNLSLHEVGF